LRKIVPHPSTLYTNKSFLNSFNLYFERDVNINFKKVTTSKGLKKGGVRGNAYPASLYLTYGAGAGVTPTQPRAGTDSDIIDRWLKTGLHLFFSL